MSMNIFSFSKYNEIKGLLSLFCTSEVEANCQSLRAGYFSIIQIHLLYIHFIRTFFSIVNTKFLNAKQYQLNYQP